MPPPSAAMSATKVSSGKREDQGHDARQDQHLHRRHAHDAQRVDFLAHLHRAEFGGDGRAGTAGDHDGGEQHAQFAQHQHADQVDGIGRGAEAAKLENALLRDDAADQEIDRHDDRHGAQREVFHVENHRGRPHQRGLERDAQRRRRQFAQKGDARHDVAADHDAPARRACAADEAGCAPLARAAARGAQKAASRSRMVWSVSRL